MSKRISRFLLPTLAAASFVSVSTVTPLASAQPAKKAEALNTKGKDLFKERRYLEAYRLFKQATELRPEGRFYFNLCFSLNYLERFQEAIRACELVEANGADAKLLKKTNAVLGALRAKVPAQTPPPDVQNPNNQDPNNQDPNNQDPNNQDPNNQDPNNQDPNNQDPNNQDPNNQDPNNQNPNNQDPNNQNSSGPATVPGFDPFAAKKANSYVWALGGGFAPLTNLGIGGSNGADFYADGGVRFNLFTNFMYKNAERIGLQGYFGLTTLPPADSVFATVSIYDFGGAAYKHIKLARNLDLTPLAGAHISLIQPEPSLDEALVAFGLRGQVSLDWSFGSTKEHVISFAPALNIYTAASDSTTIRAADYGLDSALSAALEFNFGYQYRFTTAFGSGPLFTLE